jgi:hypothetical protein
MAAVAEQQKRELKPTAEAEMLYRRWIAHLKDDFSRNENPDRRSETVRDELYQIYLGRPHGNNSITNLISETGSFVLAETFDPRNVTLEAEYMDELDWQKFAPRKPLIWFWRMFDRSPLGLNHWLGTRVRCMLGHLIFEQMGKGVTLCSGVEFRFGYNLRIEDNVKVGHNVVLDDRRPLVLNAGTIIQPGERLGGQ